MIFKNKGNELWCECGNRIIQEGFHPVDKNYNYTESDGFEENDRFYKCDRCGQLCDIDLDNVPIKEEPAG